MTLQHSRSSLQKCDRFPTAFVLSYPGKSPRRKQPSHKLVLMQMLGAEWTQGKPPCPLLGERHRCLPEQDSHGGLVLPRALPSALFSQSPQLTYRLSEGSFSCTTVSDLPQIWKESTEFARTSHSITPCFKHLNGHISHNR